MNVIDVGGTKTAAGVVTPEGEVLNEVRYPSSGPTERLLPNIARAINDVGYEVGGAYLAVPGNIMAAENRVIFSPNLHTIEDIDLKGEMKMGTGLGITVENDANAAAWGEFRIGAGAQYAHLVFVTSGPG